MWELVEHSGHRRRYSRGPSGSLAALGWIVVILLAGSLVLFVLMAIGAHASWLFIAGPLTAAAVAVGIKLWRDRSAANRSMIVVPSVYVRSHASLDGYPATGTRLSPCALCGASVRRMSRVTRSDRDAAIRVCSECAEKVQIANSEAAIKAMQLLDRPTLS